MTFIQIVKNTGFNGLFQQHLNLTLFCVWYCLWKKEKIYKYSGWERWPHLQNDVSDTGGAAALSPVPSTQDHCDEVECSDSSFSSSFDAAKP